MKEYPKAYQVDHKVTYQKGDWSFHNEVLNLKGQPVSAIVSQNMELDPEKRFPDIPTAELKDYGSYGSGDCICEVRGKKWRSRMGNACDAPVPGSMGYLKG